MRKTILVKLFYYIVLVVLKRRWPEQIKWINLFNSVKGQNLVGHL